MKSYFFSAPQAFLLMSLLMACSPKGNLESQSSFAPGNTLRKMTEGNCEDCELMFAGMPALLNSIDTSKGWNEQSQRLIINGHVYKKDKKTPAKDVIIYYYHTDAKGYYSPGEGMHQDAKRHGHLRGWIKSESDGSFRIFTMRPAQYPENTIEAHIHIIVKEPDMDTPYWIDAWVFDDDPLLTPEMRKRMENLGGSGVMKTSLENGVQYADQNVYLGLNIPGYPE